MTLSRDLLTTARRLARASPSKPRQADLRRAVSTAYYALFHALAKECADRFVGTSSRRSPDAWTQAYRAVDHGPAKNACGEAGNLGFHVNIIRFANAFTSLQEERHRADYDPDTRYSRADVLVLVANAEHAMKDFRNTPAPDRTAFAVRVLLKKRKS